MGLGGGRGGKLQILQEDHSFGRTSLNVWPHGKGKRLIFFRGLEVIWPRVFLVRAGGR